MESSTFKSDLFNGLVYGDFSIFRESFSDSMYGNRHIFDEKNESSLNPGFFASIVKTFSPKNPLVFQKEVAKLTNTMINSSFVYSEEFEESGLARLLVQEINRTNNESYSCQMLHCIINLLCTQGRQMYCFALSKSGLYRELYPIIFHPTPGLRLHDALWVTANACLLDPELCEMLLDSDFLKVLQAVHQIQKFDDMEYTKRILMVFRSIYREDMSEIHQRMMIQSFIPIFDTCLQECLALTLDVASKLMSFEGFFDEFDKIGGIDTIINSYSSVTPKIQISYLFFFVSMIDEHADRFSFIIEKFGQQLEYSMKHNQPITHRILHGMAIIMHKVADNPDVQVPEAVIEIIFNGFLHYYGDCPVRIQKALLLSVVKTLTYYPVSLSQSLLRNGLADMLVNGLDLDSPEIAEKIVGLISCILEASLRHPDSISETEYILKDAGILESLQNLAETDDQNSEMVEKLIEIFRMI